MNVRYGNNSRYWILAAVLVMLPPLSKADQLELVNGDRYVGKVVALTETNVTLRSEINGLMQVPRNKVTAITFGDKQTAPATAPKPPLAPAAVPAPKDLAAQIKAQGIDPKSIKQVQEQILGAASPEATAKFNEMVSGLIVGRLSLNDIRAKARSSVKELESAKAELGEEFGSVLDGYLNILQSFLSETEPEPAAKSKPKAKSKSPKEPPVLLEDDE